MKSRRTVSTQKSKSTKRVGSHSQGRASWTSKKRGVRRETYPDNWSEIRYTVLARDGFRCNRCGITKDKLKESGGRLEVDHIVRLADGGTNSLLNLQTLCNSCHSNRLNHRHLRIR